MDYETKVYLRLKKEVDNIIYEREKTNILEAKAFCQIKDRIDQARNSQELTDFLFKEIKFLESRINLLNDLIKRSFKESHARNRLEVCNLQLATIITLEKLLDIREDFSK